MTVARVPMIALTLLVMLAVVSCGDDDDSAPSVGASATPTGIPTPSATITPTIDVAALAGVYDLQWTNTGHQFSGSSIGVVSLAEDGRLRLELDFDVDNDIHVDVTLVGTNQMVLTGWGTFQGDIGFETEGTGVIQMDDDSFSLSGSVNDFAYGDELPSTIDFVLQRPERPYLAPFTGTYRFDFGSTPSACKGTSHAVLKLRFGDDGHGESLERATDRGTGDTVFGAFAPGPCRLSPSGLIRCSLQYAHACEPPSEWNYGIREHYLRLTGRLLIGRGDVVGAGRIETGSFLYFLGGHSWTARRRP